MEEVGEEEADRTGIMVVRGREDALLSQFDCATIDQIELALAARSVSI